MNSQISVAEASATNFAVVPAAYVLLLREEKVLLQLRQNTGFMDGYWACAAAGHVEPGESAFGAAIREAKEELGIGIAIDALIPLTTLYRSHGGDRLIDQRVDFFFACSFWIGEPSIQEPEKCADLRWFALDALPELVPDHERLVLEGYRDGTLLPIGSSGFTH